MPYLRRFASLLAATLLLPAASPSGPPVSRVRIRKAAHTLELLSGDAVLHTYKVAIGPGGAGPKGREGDQVTPVGRYHVVGRWPSVFTVFLLLDYPNAEDRARFARRKAEGVLDRGATIGGAVGIHGSPAQPEWKPRHKEVDWTLGCVAVDDDEIRAIAAVVRDGTPVDVED